MFSQIPRHQSYKNLSLHRQHDILIGWGWMVVVVFFCIEFGLIFLLLPLKMLFVLPVVILRQLLLYDVGFDRDTQMIGLAGQVGRNVIVGFLRLERGVAEVT